MQYSHLVVAIIIGFIFPLYILITGNKTRELIEQNQEKFNVVLRSAAWFLVSLCGLVIISMVVNSTELSVIGLAFVFNPLHVFTMIVTCILAYLLFSKISIPDNKVDKLKTGYKDIMYILPENKKQCNTAVFVSIIAGVCEEIMFRGFLYWQLQQYMPVVAAFILTNIMFAIAHAGTKLKNALSTLVLGVIYSATYVLTDSLWLAIVLHILLDFYAMIMGYKLKQKLKTI